MQGMTFSQWLEKEPSGSLWCHNTDHTTFKIPKRTSSRPPCHPQRPANQSTRRHRRHQSGPRARSCSSRRVGTSTFARIVSTRRYECIHLGRHIRFDDTNSPTHCVASATCIRNRERSVHGMEINLRRAPTCLGVEGGGRQEAVLPRESELQWPLESAKRKGPRNSQKANVCFPRVQ